MLGRRFLSVLVSLISVSMVLAAGTLVLFYAENTPLADAWNPTKPLSINDPMTRLTHWKLNRALGTGDACRAALATGATFTALPEKIDGANCGIKDHVVLSNVGTARVAPVNTRCQIALRWAMWAAHDLQPKAKDLFGQHISKIRHFSSYNCRQMRTTNGSGGRMSTHATAEAIDISGFDLQDETRIDLKKHWNEAGAKSAFLNHANATACDWFRLTLGPEYNALHADHFHLQHTGWGLCR